MGRLMVRSILGGYVYIDLIPFIDVEFDFNMISNTYDIEFQNELGSMPPISFSWGSVNTYTTVRRKVAGLSIPFLAAAKAHAGLGVNSHTTLPVADVDMVKSLLNGNLEADPSDLDQALLGFLKMMIIPLSPLVSMFKQACSLNC